MDQQDTTTRMTRRDALKSAVALFGGSIALAQLGPVAHAMAVAEQSGPRFLSPDQLSVLNRAVDIIIPRTDTPGAAAAGVHYFIDSMLADWANDESRERMSSAIADIDAKSQDTHGKRFVELDNDQQSVLLEAMDNEIYALPDDADVPFGMLKWATIFGYYTSEVGASVELKFNPIPGPSPGCVPFKEDDRAWYKHGGF